VLLGAVVHLATFSIIYLNIPNEATLRPTKEASYLGTPSPELAMVCAVLLGNRDPTGM